jgi:DNA-binding HxlR family transcriptional regulator
VNGLTLEELCRSTRSYPEMMLEVLRDEIRLGRVRRVENGRVEFELTEAGRRELAPLLLGADGLTAIREVR